MFGARVLMVGVAYKPDVTDVRESPALEIIDGLHAARAQVGYTDAHVEQIRTPHGVLHRQPPVATGWDLVIVHTQHPGVDHAWLDAAPLVLDTTYRLANTPRCHAL